MTDKWHFKLGASAFRHGKPMPPMPSDDEAGSQIAAYWYGYMLERAAKLQKCWDAQRILEEPDHDPDDRGPKAMAA